VVGKIGAGVGATGGVRTDCARAPQEWGGSRGNSSGGQMNELLSLSPSLSLTLSPSPSPSLSLTLSAPPSPSLSLPLSLSPSLSRSLRAELN
jgi:hypothetical protein